MAISADRFKKLTEHIGCFPDTTNIGLIDTEEGLYLVDSGNSSDDGKALVEAASKLYPGKKIVGILCTHAHNDHCGGNKIIKEMTGAKIWASKKTTRILEVPETIAFIFWGGLPFSSINEQSFSASGEYEVDCTMVAGEAFKLGKNISVMSVLLPGHYFEQLGILVSDSDGHSVFFLGDACFGSDMIKKYWIPYMIDPVEFRSSIKKIMDIDSDFYVPGHGETCDREKIQAIGEMNIIITLETEVLIQNVLKKADMTHEELLEAIADYAGIEMRLGQFVLIGSTIKSYLGSMYNRGMVTFRMDSNRMVWSIPQHEN